MAPFRSTPILTDPFYYRRVSPQFDGLTPALAHVFEPGRVNAVNCGRRAGINGPNAQPFRHGGRQGGINDMGKISANVGARQMKSSVWRGWTKGLG